MRSLDKGSMHLIVTSPPYNLGKDYEKKTTNEVYIEQQAATIAEAVRLLHDNGSLCWQVGNYVDDGEVYSLDILLYNIFKNIGLKLRHRIVWTFGQVFIARSASRTITRTMDNSLMMSKPSSARRIAEGTLFTGKHLRRCASKTNIYTIAGPD